ncbi:helix-turn-helix domain-containing protein [Gordonia malaquae]|uniref:helix-turn-helix domain-containing protein n=1 Tax=Gordonia malaquae TaxID=410332 RepID=UPI003019B617
MGVSEAARLLRVNPVTVLRLIKAGELAAEQMPGKTGAYLLQRSDVEDLAAKRAAKKAGA